MTTDSTTPTGSNLADIAKHVAAWDSVNYVFRTPISGVASLYLSLRSFFADL